MKYSFNWLKEFLPGFDSSPIEVAERLTNSGLEVEKVEDLSEPFKGIVVGEVLTKTRHPNADRLSLVTVSDGKEILSVVCGAPNVTVRGKYPFARLGVSIPTGMEIKKISIRGVESSGMLCSAREMGLSEESTGLLELPEKAKTGTSLAESLGLDDVILHVNITPNRGDCLSHWGLARELVLFFGVPLRIEKKYDLKGSYQSKDYLRVRIKDRGGCSRYCARVIRGLKVTPSPDGLKKRLSCLGVRSVNNVVDATNFVMLELGHPLHAFDHRFIRGGEITVQGAAGFGTFKALDETERTLLPDDLVIADGEGPLALAGIIGGKGSEIRDNTTTIVLEAAAFDPVRIRRTSKRLSLSTESSYRFERSVPPETVPLALDRVTRLILDLAGGEPSSDRVDLFVRHPPKRNVTLSRERLNGIVGGSVPDTKVFAFLGALGLSPRKKKGGWLCVAPPHRSDLTREIDLVEEVVRLYGFDKIPSNLPRTTMGMPAEEKRSQLERVVSDFFVSRGFFETIHLSFNSPDEVEAIGTKNSDAVCLKNPLSREQAVLRSSLLPSLLACCRRNQSVGEKDFRFFELRSIFTPPHGESRHLAGIYGGEFFPPNWQKLAKKGDLFFGKGVLSDLMRCGRIGPVSFHPGEARPIFHPAESFRISCENRELGMLGRLHPELLEKLDIGSPLYFFDMDYPTLVSLWGHDSFSLKRRGSFPSIARDLSLVVNEGLAYGKVAEEIDRAKSPWLVHYSLYDVYGGDSVPSGKKSLTLSFVYESSERTLTDDEVNKAHFGLVEVLGRNLGGVLR